MFLSQRGNRESSHEENGEAAAKGHHRQCFLVDRTSISAAPPGMIVRRSARKMATRGRFRKACRAVMAAKRRSR
jgi:hypothetical protein